MIDWEQIAREHGPLVWRTVYRLLGYGGADAADCFQETFLTALGYAGRQDVRNWPGLLQRIATTRALDTLARRKTESRRRGRVADDDFDGVPSERCGPDAASQESELMDQFRIALAELPAGQREVFCLRHLGAMSYEEIAAETGSTSDAVGVTLHRARMRLKALMTAAGVSGDTDRYAAAPSPPPPRQPGAPIGSAGGVTGAR
jgi:RNA polymerase sigma-70 factor (ECF subfamily)